MTGGSSHLSSRDLLLYLDGEAPDRERRRVSSHLEACWSCRARKQQLENSVASYVEFHQNAELPSIDGPRALLEARLAEEGEFLTPPPLAKRSFVYTAAALAAAALLTMALVRVWPVTPLNPPSVVMVPNRRLTPGVAVLAAPADLCGENLPGNRSVPGALRRRVLDEYGLRNSADSFYEVDYLISPALGGADDIRNLWPHSYAGTQWNAHVKDALEDRLRKLVCAGEVDLPTAQREISANWIEAYKKYFHTDRPIPSTD